MQLILIEHYRCGDKWAYDTMVWAPDDWTPEIIDEKLSAAKNNYLDDLNAYKKWVEERGRQDGENWELSVATGPNYSKYTDKSKTLAEIDAEFEIKKRKFMEDSKDRWRGSKAFIYHLEDEGFVRFSDHEFENTFSIDWGHRHGMMIDYSPTKFNDLPGAKELLQKDGP